MIDASSLLGLISLTAVGLVGLHRHQRPKRRRHVEIRQHDVLDCLPVGIVIISDAGRIQYANAAFQAIVGRLDGSLIGVPMDDLGWIRSTPLRQPWLPTADEYRLLLEQPSRQRRVLSMRARRLSRDSVQEDTDHNTRRFDKLTVIAMRDVTDDEHYRAEVELILAQNRRRQDEHQERVEQLKLLTQVDALTECGNRRALADQADLLYDESTESSTPLSCIMFDIDHFKSVNDTHGHAAGDEVLRQVSAALRGTFAAVGQVYRYGGEEFCVLLPGHQAAESCRTAEQVRSTIESMRVDVTDTREQVSPTVSVGVSDLTLGATSAEELIAQADKCLYIAKRRGRNQVVLYNEEVANARVRRSDSNGSFLR
ncbi:MAG: diguanylate cyclase [Planctomycetota bacterium]